MARFTYLAEVDAEGITFLAWASGLAQGSGNTRAAEALQRILGSIQPVELDDETEAAFDEQQDEGELIQLFEDETTLDEDEDADRTPDPTFMPPAPTPPMNRQEDFGAGPPPNFLG